MRDCNKYLYIIYRSRYISLFNIYVGTYSFNQKLLYYNNMHNIILVQYNLQFIIHDEYNDFTDVILIF